MRTCPAEPSAGDRISASWMRELVRYIRSITPLAGPGVKLSTGPNGTILSCVQASKAAAASPLPWSFACTIEAGGEGEEETRTGGWTNCRLQIGLDVSWRSPDIDDDDPYHTILGTDLCDDGTHYLEVTLANGVYDPEAGIDRLRDSAEIKIASPGESVPASDYVGGIIRIPLGTVTDGKIGYTPHFNPVVYKSL